MPAATRRAVAFDRLHGDIAGALDTGDADIAVEQLLDLFRDLADRYDTDVNSPLNMGYYCIDADVASLAALEETERRASNIAVEDQHPASLAFELHSIELVLQAFGIDPATGHGHYTSGGTESDLTAMIVALGDRVTHRNETLPASAYDPALTAQASGKAEPYEYVLHGALPMKRRPTVYVTPQTHVAIQKNARTLIGASSVRTVAMDSELRMSPAALEKAIAEDRQGETFFPFMVVATVGATGTGIIDPLPKIGEICRRNSLWLHVDAPWGGIAAFSPTMKKKCLDGIEHVDSITFDPHKTLVPLGAGGSGMFLTRHRAAVERAFNVSGHPVSTHDYGYMSLQGSRPNNGLRVLSQLIQPRRLAERIEREARLGDLMRRRLRASGWRITSKTPLPVVTAIHPAMLEGKTTAARVVAWLAERGVLAKSETITQGQPASVRLGIISRRTSEVHVEAVVGMLNDAVA